MTPANSLDSARTPRRNGRRINRKSPRLHTYDVKGYISKCWMEFRVKALNADAAIAIAHDRCMAVRECIEVQHHTYPLNGIGFGKGRTRDTV